MPKKSKIENQKNSPQSQLIPGLIPLIIVLIGLLLLGFFVSRFYVSDRFTKRVVQCNTSPQQFRFSCYREAMERYYGGRPDEFIKRIENSKESDVDFSSKNKKGEVTYAIFGTNCHTFYHAAGDFVATHYEHKGKSIKELLTYGPTVCTNGYTMGLYKRLAIQKGYPPALFEQYWKNCIKGAENQCAHEIGHILHDKYFVSILQTLDAISKKEYGLTYPEKYTYVMMKKTDLDAPFEDCRKYIPGAKVAQCYTGIGHNLFLFSEFSKDGYKTYFNQCNQVKEADQENCYGFFIFRIGINEGAVRFLNNDFAAGNKICSDSIEQALLQHPGFGQDRLNTHCYRGIGGGIGLWIDSEYNLAKINNTNLTSIKKDLNQYAALCEKSQTPEDQSECYRGLLGTKFLKYYRQLGLYNEKIELLLPRLGDDFEVVG